ncbi:MAG: hypothetical protein GX362_06905 [Methanosarcinaceae archaeon]|nr:hypothetical protein [Methanosarcinaceae archaeon]
MAETIQEILNQSLKLWKTNLPISVAYVLYSILNVIVSIAGIGIISYLLLKDIPAELVSPELFKFNNEALLNQFGEHLIKALTTNWNWLIILITILVLFIIVALITAYFYAGLTGMCKIANENGKTGFSDLMKYGKDYFIKMLVGFILYFIVLMIITIPCSFIIGLVNILLTMIHPYLAAIMNQIFGLFMTLIALFLTFSLYSIVIEENKGALNGFKAGLSFIINNLKDASILVILLTIVSFLFSLLMNIMSFAFFYLYSMNLSIVLITVIGILLGLVTIIISLLSIAFINPYFHIAFVRLYMSRTNKYLRSKK